MIADHAGLALFPSTGLFRCVGRISFPIYCFLIVQGFMHTRDIRAYGRRLLLMALLSEIPFDLLIFSRTVCAAEQNVFFALLLGLLALCSVQMLQGRPAHAFAASLLICLGAMASRVSYGYLGVVLCLAAYYAGQSKLRLCLYMGGALLLYSLGLLLSGVAISWVLTSLFALLSLPLLLAYNKARGPRTPLLTFAFYAAYPLHILLLVFLRAARIIPPHLFS